MNISSNSSVQSVDEFFDKKVYLNPDICFSLKENPVYDSHFRETDLESLKMYEETILKQSNRIDELSTDELDELIGLFDKVFKKNDTYENYELRYLPLEDNIRAMCTIGDKELFEKIVEECMKRDPHNVYIPFLAAYSYYLKVVESSMYADDEHYQLEMDQNRKNNHLEWCSKGIEYCKKGLDIFSSIPIDSLPEQNPNLKYHTEDLLKDRPIVNRPDLKLFPFNFSFILSILHSEMATMKNSDPDTKKFHVDQAMLYSQRNVYVKGFVKNYLSSYGVALYASGDYEKAIQVLEQLEFKKTSALWYESIIMCQAMIHLGQFDKCIQFINLLIPFMAVQNLVTIDLE